MSSSVLIALPAILVFAFAGRYFVTGLAASAVEERLGCVDGGDLACEWGLKRCGAPSREFC
jgi:hypothetical protein